MRSDNRLSRMLHVLIHMDRHDGPVTSDVLARMLNTNPVVVRRMMGGLRDQGYVESEKGHGGGWVLARKLGQMSLLDVYSALGEPPVFALGLAEDHPRCLVEQAVNAGLKEALEASKRQLLVAFGDITVADLARDVDERSKK